MNNRPICQSCLQRPASINYMKNDIYHFRSRCDYCLRNDKKIKPVKSTWALSGYKKKPHCEKCGFKSEYTEQLTVYHIDGCMKNSNLLNLKTICLNCQITISKQGLGWKQGALVPDF